MISDVYNIWPLGAGAGARYTQIMLKLYIQDNVSLESLLIFFKVKSVQIVQTRDF
jgi:hypothetical protein